MLRKQFRHRLMKLKSRDNNFREFILHMKMKSKGKVKWHKRSLTWKINVVILKQKSTKSKNTLMWLNKRKQKRMSKLKFLTKRSMNFLFIKKKIVILNMTLNSLNNKQSILNRKFYDFLICNKKKDIKVKSISILLQDCKEK